MGARHTTSDAGNENKLLFHKDEIDGKNKAYGGGEMVPTEAFALEEESGK